MSVPPAPDTAPGGSLPPKALADLVVSRRAEREDMALISLIRVGDLIRGFANYLEACGVESSVGITESHAAAFVRSLTRSKTEPSVATMHLRRTALRIFFRETKALGLHSIDPTVSIPLPRVPIVICDP